MQTITATTEQVLNNHMISVQNRDLAAIMADYREDAVLILASGVYKGKEAIQRFYRNTFETLFTEGFTIELQQQVIENDLIYIIWKANSSTCDIPQATDTFLVQEGLIVWQTVFAIVNPV